MLKTINIRIQYDKMHELYGVTNNIRIQLSKGISFHESDQYGFNVTDSPDYGIPEEREVNGKLCHVFQSKMNFEDGPI